MAKRIIKCRVNDEYVVGSGVPIGAAGSHDDVVLRLEFNDTWDDLYIYATFRDALGGHPTVVLLLRTMLADGESRIYEVTVPAAAKLYAGKAMFTLTGYLTKQEETEDGIKRTVEDSATNTATAYFPVLPSDYAFAEDGSIDASLAEQLQGEITRHEAEVDDELSAMQATLDAELEDHKAATAAEIAKHKTEVDGALEAQYEEIDGAVSSAAEAVRIADELKARADAGEFIGEPGKKGDKGDPGSISFIIVTELPEDNIDESAIYLVPAENPSEDNKFVEYFYANGRWEMLPGGGINIDLTEYLKKSDAANAGQIVEKTRTNKYLSPYYLDEIMRIGLTTNAKVLTDEEKAAALAWLGAVPKQKGEPDGGATRGFAYGLDPNGETTQLYRLQIQSNVGTIPLRDGWGNFYVANPELDYHCVNKKYVDNAIAAITDGEEVEY